MQTLWTSRCCSGLSCSGILQFAMSLPQPMTLSSSSNFQRADCLQRSILPSPASGITTCSALVPFSLGTDPIISSDLIRRNYIRPSHVADAKDLQTHARWTTVYFGEPALPLLGALSMHILLAGRSVPSGFDETLRVFEHAAAPGVCGVSETEDWTKTHAQPLKSSATVAQMFGTGSWRKTTSLKPWPGPVTTR
ncbi:hypothetical protein N658DRAFT_493763 [Parathielavia hyrcaniae]|uniref:Uncharacterized protein n=1 Tax=Parathielavia hyrcaniae TaxID=113614 RepID=A0AAN6QBM7_9PEZI|nr:hypothetical protein N658DRAFT_493763 [Parathielavia hyrcaniae]